MTYSLIAYDNAGQTNTRQVIMQIVEATIQNQLVCYAW